MIIVRKQYSMLGGITWCYYFKFLSCCGQIMIIIIHTIQSRQKLWITKLSNSIFRKGKCFLFIIIQNAYHGELFHLHATQHQDSPLRKHRRHFLSLCHQQTGSLPDTCMSCSHQWMGNFLTHPCFAVGMT